MAISLGTNAVVVTKVQCTPLPRLVKRDNTEVPSIHFLTFTTIWVHSADHKLMIFFLFSQKTKINISICLLAENFTRMSKR